MIINGNKKNKFRRKHVVKVTFHNIFFKKGWCKSDVVLYLSVINPLLEFPEPVIIFNISSFL